MANLIRLYGLSQEECARRLGRSQSAVANKLRLLKLPDDILAALEANSLTERHGRALLRLADEEARRAALEHIIAEGLNVAQTDRYIDSLLAKAPEKKAPGEASADTQGRARLPQQHIPQPRDYEAGRHRRRV